MAQNQPIRIKDGEFQEGLCDFFSGGHCFEGCCCPCIVVNKTQQLLDDPDEKTPSGCGCMGCAWCLLTTFAGMSCFVGWKQRNDMRKRYQIEGGSCGDMWKNLCCPCCSVIQQYKEVEMRRDARANKVGYQTQAPMRAPGH
ncbi:PLAC8 family-domain-containing protein [Chaetomidium leptoderma]|uniref:PLAC8 family-domain-containing protein n=1 Tax=Chaetomidium leptoderma TaxID=669021 RepID=A0AAN6VLI6_9PEZI|nr:PLAC8 family-domain-containing protein [Chaetomidium leptoderma]